MPKTTVYFYQDDDGSIPVRDWLDALRLREAKACSRCIDALGRLEAAGLELRRPNADYLRDGIYELRVRYGKVHFRLLYFFHGSSAVVVGHGLTKEERVPNRDIDLAVRRKRKVESNVDRHTLRWHGGVE